MKYLVVVTDQHRQQLNKAVPTRIGVLVDELSELDAQDAALRHPMFGAQTMRIEHIVEFDILLA